MINIFYCHVSVCKNTINHLCKKAQCILAMDPGKGMANKNLPTEGNEHLGGLTLGTKVTLFSLHGEAKIINFDDDTLKRSKPSKV